MKRETLQSLIDRASTPAEMLEIGCAYLEGTVLKDKTAADAWLSRAVEAEDPVVSPRAMALIAREILGRDRALSLEDERDIRARLQSAGDGERQALEALLEENYHE